MKSGAGENTKATSETSRVRWFSDEPEALEEAKRTGKPILVDFLDPGCTGCQRLDAVTYPSKAVASYVNEHFVALRVDLTAQQNLASKYDVSSPPTVLVLNPEGREFYRSLGFLPPDRLLCHLEMGRAMVLFRTGRYTEAAELFDKVALRRPICSLTPEAIYYRGVARDKISRDHSNRKVSARELADRFPDSDWAFRADPALEEEE